MIYFDNSATTKPSAACTDAMMQVLTEAWGNPSSRHTMGVEAHKILATARQQIFSALGVRAMNAKDENLIFTASGTEADNLAVLGTARAKKALAGGKCITTDAEHPAVLRPFSVLENEGFRTAYIHTKNGVFDMEQFRREMTPDTFLISVMLVNNETGAVNDIRAISDYAKSVNPECIVHTDAVQGFLKIPFTPQSLGADLVTVSAHKIHGPKGVGALYISPYLIKRRAVSPVIFGGGQESDFRSGTENLPGIAGFGAAAAAGSASIQDDIAHMTALRDYIAQKLSADETLSAVRVNLPQSEMRAPHILSIRLPKIKSETMLNYLSGRGIAISSGSACSAQSGRISNALLCFGLSESDADTTLRISLCPENTTGEADIFLDALRMGIKMLARMKR
ncbi:MAG: cysteine desulfurase [Clostridia bacterium]|nr:cysteine desulfurase [Clostridia bacterium]